MRWKSYGRRQVYKSDWVNVWLEDVEIPGGDRFDHHVLTMPKGSNTAVVTDDEDRMLLLWRHRFITDEWGWEVPAGWSDPGETSDEAIAREIEEETGWRPGEVHQMVSYNALSGISTMRFASFHATGASRIGPPADPAESSRVEWVPLDKVGELVRAGDVPDGPSLTAISYFLALHRCEQPCRRST